MGDTQKSFFNIACTIYYLKPHYVLATVSGLFDLLETESKQNIMIQYNFYIFNICWNTTMDVHEFPTTGAPSLVKAQNIIDKTLNWVSSDIYFERCPQNNIYQILNLISQLFKSISEKCHFLSDGYCEEE